MRAPQVFFKVECMHKSANDERGNSKKSLLMGNLSLLTVMSMNASHQCSEEHRKSIYRLKGGLEEVVREEVSSKIQEGVSDVCLLSLSCS